jgi:hypothetical protein
MRELLRTLALSLSYAVTGKEVAAHPDVISKRVEICYSCPERRGDKCGLCRCPIHRKTAPAASRCPPEVGKW